jgi:hypothetical protein
MLFLEAVSVVPTALETSLDFPGAEAPGYYHASLRDEYHASLRDELCAPFRDEFYEQKRRG